jgi:hypothetical protein
MIHNNDESNISLKHKSKFGDLSGKIVYIIELTIIKRQFNNRCS